MRRLHRCVVQFLSLRYLGCGANMQIKKAEHLFILIDAIRHLREPVPFLPDDQL